MPNLESVLVRKMWGLSATNWYRTLTVNCFSDSSTICWDVVTGTHTWAFHRKSGSLCIQDLYQIFYSFGKNIKLKVHRSDCLSSRTSFSKICLAHSLISLKRITYARKMEEIDEASALMKLQCSSVVATNSAPCSRKVRCCGLRICYWTHWKWR